MSKDKYPFKVFNCGENGTIMPAAILVSILAHKGIARIEGEGSLKNRPLQDSFLDALKQMGVRFGSNDGRLPITVFCGSNFKIDPPEIDVLIEKALAILNKNPELIEKLNPMFQELEYLEAT